MHPRPHATGRRTSIAGIFAATLALAAITVGPAGAGLAAPAPAAPANGAVVDAVPPFAWTAVAGADRYEIEVSADPGFNSDVANVTTRNLRATLSKVIPNGEYWWHVRAITAAGGLGPWSAPQSFEMAWTAKPSLLAPGNGATLEYPDDPFRLRWSVVPGAAEYLVKLATDPALASLVWSSGPVKTSATSFTTSAPLAPGTYYWAITPLNSEGHAGTQSTIASFVWQWPSATTPTLTDMADEPELFDPLFSWTRVEGAAGYEVEVNSSSDWASGSRVCCSPLRAGTQMTTLGLSLAPLVQLDNNTYYWRVRPIDPSGNAGSWSVGDPFTKTFANVPPTTPPSVKNLRLRDHAADPYDGLDPAGVGYPVATGTPILSWNPVPGASSYQVEVTLHEDGACNWTSPFEHWVKTVTGTAWTPLGWSWNGVKPYPSTLLVSSDVTTALVNGHSYCARVRPIDGPSALTGPTVNGDWTYLPQNGTAAFTWSGVPDAECESPCSLPDASYLLPQRGSTTGRMPLFTWTPLPGAKAYFVIVARDPSFTNLIDYAFTRIPAYAPRTANMTRSYPDELTSYYWVVLPARNADGSGVSAQPLDGSPPDFHKQATPPTRIAPANGAVISGPTTFRWTSAESARRYRIEIAKDASFSDVIDSKLTDSTAYTSTTTYPADIALYWRVRADAEDGSTFVGLTWSATGTFQKQLPTPTPDPGNPTAGAMIPSWTWSAVPGAVSYDVSIEEPDGDRQTIPNLPTHAFTPTKMTGIGIFHIQVRANFPTENAQPVRGPYSPLMTFARTIPEPANTATSAGPSHLLFSWDPRVGADAYRVQVSTRPDFAMLLEQVTTQSTAHAPLLTQRDYTDGGTFYWRVATIDADLNRGDWSAPRSISLIRTLQLNAYGALYRGRPSTLTVFTRTSKGPVAGAAVRVWGAGLKARTVKTNAKGQVTLRFTPRRKGALYVRATKAGFRTTTVKLTVGVLK